MKRTTKITGSLVLTVFSLLVIISLSSGSIITKYLLPSAAELLGVQVALKSSSLNLFSGLFSAKGLTVSNPEGFKEPHFITADKASVRVSLLSLIRGRIVLSSASLDNFTVNVVRNENGSINANHFAARLQSEKTKAPAQPGTTAARTPAFKVSNMNATIRLRYIDHAFTTNTLDYSFLTSVKIDGISNFEAPEDYGTFTINGHLENNPQVLSSSITGRVATLSNPLEPTFEVNGQIKSIHVDALDDLAHKIGLYSKEFIIDTPVKSTNGRLRGDLKITFKEPMPLGTLAKKLKNTQLPPVITATVPVRGKVESPRIDWAGAVMQSLLDNALGNLEHTLKNIKIGPDDIEKQIDGVVDTFKGIFNKKKKQEK
ncbi:MAG: hypothetical protein K0B84_11690 [Firmicutes bacterium]|nr:hypothetical protein [Bacillota bacterium]